MLGISVACSLTGFLLSINGSYQYIFLSADKVSEATVRFGNTFLYVDIALYAILGFLIVTRSAVQGICRSGYVLGAGIAELFARILICSFLPATINGAPIDASASTLAFAAMCFGDPGAASVLLLIPLTRNIIRMHYPELADRGDFAGKALDKQEQ